jgi:hypothetical protein
MGVTMSMHRREFIHLIGTSVAGATAVAAATRTSAGLTSAAAATDDWVVVEVLPVDRGAVPIVLQRQSTGERLHVEACRRGSRQRPVAQSARFDLFLANHGEGSARTARDHELAARALAAALDARGAEVPAEVVTLDERHQREASAAAA